MKPNLSVPVQIPVNPIGFPLSPEQIKAYRIADNQTATLADWDHDLLSAELRKLLEFDYEMELLGFDEAELERLIDPASLLGNIDEDLVPETPEVPDSQPGVIYELGRHRLLVGDATDAGCVGRLMGTDT